MLSKKTKYAIKALVVLGKNIGQPPLSIFSIANTENIPKKFLEQILLDLRNAGYVYNKKGIGGGYSLNKNPEEILLIDIMRITNGPIAMVPCASHKFYHRCDECKNESICGLRDILVNVHNITVKILSETSILEIINREAILINLNNLPYI